ncbi:Histone-Lysine N-Methyltransferase ash1l [Boothiomyces sp. JEL0866]|nr:Histone-Lysine N-Methyltransferase ash1l [Boothiomyces sp. JEL0866]
MLTSQNYRKAGMRDVTEQSDQTMQDQEMDGVQDDQFNYPSRDECRNSSISINMIVENPVQMNGMVGSGNPAKMNNVKSEYFEALQRLQYLEENNIYEDAVSLSTVSDSISDREYDFNHQLSYDLPDSEMQTPKKVYKYSSRSVPPKGLSRSTRLSATLDAPTSLRTRRRTGVYSETEDYPPTKYSEIRIKNGQSAIKFDPLNPELFLYGKRRKGRPRIYPVKEITPRKYKPIKLFASMGRPRKNPSANDLLTMNVAKTVNQVEEPIPEPPTKKIRSQSMTETPALPVPRATRNSSLTATEPETPTVQKQWKKQVGRPKKTQTVAPSNTVPDYAHPLLASLRVRRRLGLKKSLKSSDPEDFELKNLSHEYFLEISKDRKNPLNIKEQILAFFHSPCPAVFSGPQDTGDRMQGALLEYNLRELVGANNEALFENLISYRDIKNTEIEDAVDKVNGDDPLNTELDRLEARKSYQSVMLQPWGTKSEHYANQWDGQLKELYNKKNFLRAGLYAENIDTIPPKFYSDSNFKFPMPINEGESILSNTEHFDIPHDIKLFVDLNGGLCANLDIYVDRKPRKAEAPAICFCELPEDGSPACGPSCLNRCMYIECTSDCPNGDRCSNKRFERKEVVKKVNVIKCPGRGFGLQTQEFIPKGKFIMEYRGEIISDATCHERMRTIYANASNHYFLNYGLGEVIDGYRKGTIARFANHSCDPNCHIEKWSYDGECRIGLFASKDIQPGSELTYDYKFESFGPLQKCMCQSENCRGFIGLNKKDDDDEKVWKSQKPTKRKVDYQAIVQEEEEDAPTNEVIVPRNSKKLTYGSVNIAYKYALPHRPRHLFLLRNFKTLYKHNHLSISRKIRITRRNTLDTIIENLYDGTELGPEETCVITRKGELAISKNNNQPLYSIWVGDSSGSVILSLWGDIWENLSPGDMLKLTDVYAQFRNKRLQLSLERTGKGSDVICCYTKYVACILEGGRYQSYSAQMGANWRRTIFRLLSWDNDTKANDTMDISEST